MRQLLNVCRSHYVRLAVMIPGFALLSSRGVSQEGGSVRGKVTAENGIGLSGATIVVAGTKVRALSDDSGTFRVTGLPPGQANIHVKRLGFLPDSASIQIAADGSAELNIKLAVAAENLVPVMVRARRISYSGRLAGYYERLDRRNGGVFITREQIDQDRPRTLSQLLQRVPGVTLVRLRAGATGVRLRDRTCAPLIWLDGNALPSGEVDLDSFQPNSLQGIELYLGSTTAPTRYLASRDLSNCGTILLWSRSGETEFPQEVPRTAGLIADIVASQAIFTADQVDEAARVDSQAPLEPAYPTSLNAAHTDGLVIAEFVVSASGKMEEDTFGVISSTHPLFTDAVRTALRRAAFLPARIKGVAVRQLVHQPFQFKGGG